MKPLPIPQRLWTANPDAAAILASCVQRPPQTRVVRVEGLSTYHAEQYVGERVKSLNAMWNAERERLLRLADQSGNYDAYASHCAHSVQDAIDDARFIAAMSPRFAGLKGVGA